MTYVFVSYFREDVSKIRPLLDALDKLSIAYWIDEVGMELGEQWREKVKRKIDQAGAFLLCVSDQFYLRPTSYVHAELAIAIERAKTLAPSVPWLLPICLDQTKLPEVSIDETRSLTDLHSIRLADGDYNAIEHTALRLNAILTNPSLSLANIVVTSLKIAFRPTIIAGAEPFRIESLLYYHDLHPSGGDILLADGSWMPFPEYWKAYSDWFFDDLRRRENKQGGRVDRPHEPKVVVSNSSLRFQVRPGRIHLTAASFEHEQVIGQYGQKQGTTVSKWHSNTISFDVGARETKILLLRDTPASGFLWRNRPTKSDYYFTEIG